MPPKLPLQSKDIAKIFSSVRNRFDSSNTQAAGDEKNQPNITSHIAHIEKNFSEATQPQEAYTDLITRQGFSSFGNQGILERLGLGNFPRQVASERPLSFNEESDVIKQDLGRKISFDDNISPTQQEMIVGGLNELITKRSTSPLVRDVLKSTSDSTSVDKINFGVTSPTILATLMANSSDLFAASKQEVEIYDVDNATSKQDAIRSAVRTSTYVFQREMTQNEKTKDIYDYESLSSSFLRDILENYDNKKVAGIYNKVFGASALNNNINKDEATRVVRAMHANVVAEMAIDQNETRQNFPNALETIEKIHAQYKSAIAPEKSVQPSVAR